MAHATARGPALRERTTFPGKVPASPGSSGFQTLPPGASAIGSSVRQVSPSPRWLRIRLADGLPLPVAGRRITLAADETGTDEPLTAVVVRCRPTSEPGWVEVEIAPD
jgi:hypothetical protein